MISTNSTPATTETKQDTTFDVILVGKPRILTNSDSRQAISFNLKVNGVIINNCMYSSGTSKDGAPYEIVNLPQREYTDKDGKKQYSNVCYFPINTFKDKIIADLQEALNK